MMPARCRNAPPKRREAARRPLRCSRSCRGSTIFADRGPTIGAMQLLTERRSWRARCSIALTSSCLGLVLI
jgi:hypothetical protein